MPDNVSRERKTIIRAFGAEVDLQRAGSRARTAPSCSAARCSTRIPERYFKPDQYFNRANPQAHYESTGPEIWEQTEGTRHRTSSPASAPAAPIMGTGRYLKERESAPSRSIAAEPDDAFHGLEGLKHMAIVDRAGHLPRGASSTEKSRCRPTTPTISSTSSARRTGFIVGQSVAARRCRAARSVARELDDGVIVRDLPGLRRSLPEHEPVARMGRMAASTDATERQARRLLHGCGRDRGERSTSPTRCG